MATTEAPAVPGLVRRVAAFAVDCMVVSTMLGIATAVSYQQACELGPWGRLVGAVVAVAYFGLANSRVFEGRSVGKRLLGTRVVTLTGCAPSPAVSLARSALIIAPLALNGAALPVWMIENLVIGLLLNVFLLGLPFANGYLLLFSRPSRRCMHDIVFGTVVVMAPVQQSALSRTKGLHLVVALLLLASATLVPAALFWRHATVLVGRSAPLLRKLSSIPAVWGAKVSVVNTSRVTIHGRQDPVARLAVAVRTSGENATFDGLSRRLAGAALSEWPDMAQVNLLSVAVTYGVDLFLFGWSNTQNRTATPEAWRIELGVKKEAGTSQPTHQ